MKNWFKENSAHLIVIAIFVALVFFYFTPVWQGQTLAQSDVVQAQGAQKEMFDYKAQDGKAPLWTNSMFGGMPTYQIWSASENNIGTYILAAVKTVFPQPIDIVLFYLLAGYFLLSVLRVRPWLAALGAIAIAFTSYNFIYIEAGHVTKAYAIAFIPPVIGAVIMCFRGSRLWGPVLLALFMALEIRVNHLQMTYYMLIALMVYVIFALVYAIRDKKVKEFFIASGLQLAAVIVAVMVNASILIPTYEYSKLSTRGHANITKVDASKEKGLDKQYAYEWSQGVGETLTFLIPNAYGGGSSGVLDEKSNVAKFLMSTFGAQGMTNVQAAEIASRMPVYWGDKPFTSGPWYFGAGVLFLFILGLVIVNNRLKWWILTTTVLILLLSFGKNFTLVSDLFFDYFPMYNKFRAVESILVIAAILIPLMAVLTLNELITKADKIEKLDKKVLYTFIGIGVICLLVAFVPDLFLSFKNKDHAQLIASLTQQVGDQNAANQWANSLIKDRSAVASADAYRSFAIVLITFLAIWFYIKKKLSANVLIIGLAVIFLFDLWSVDKRFLNDKSFMEKRLVTSQAFQEREVDQLIRMDKDLSYRVIDLTTNPFSDARASYYHKSLGGYHAAKLMRFQEILENQFNGAVNEDVLDMFNVRYVITGDEQKGQRIQRRSSAAGNAWFVDQVTFVKDNAQEMQAISSFNPSKEAFVSEEFKDKFNGQRLGVPVNASIKLTSYHPDKMVYEYSTPTEAFAVFSEVYYEKGWKAFVDGKEVPIIRADYILRALQLPGGNHKVEFIFDPESHKLGGMLTLIASIILGLGLVAAVYYSVKNDKTKKATT